MPLDNQTIAALGSQLAAAEANRRPVPRLSETHPELDMEKAYRIQRELQRLKERSGARVIGYKMGVTSIAKMKQIGIDRPVFGFLTDGMRAADAGRIEIDPLIHPRVEPEIAFVMEREISASQVSIDEVISCTGYIAPAIEVLDSRIVSFKPDLTSGIADNTSAARFALGHGVSPEKVDLAALRVTLEINGRQTALGVGADVLGHPARSVAMLVELLAAQGRSLPAGSVVLSGGITEAVNVGRGDRVRVSIERLGEVNLTFV
jgi:2-oxo-3-hexenedioate decarboxylase